MSRTVQINAPVYVTSSFAQVTAVRSFDGVYQNTSPGPRLVSVCAGTLTPNTQGAATPWISPDAIQEPVNWYRVGADYFSYFTGGPNLFHTQSFIVPPGWYYKLSRMVTATIIEWAEWDFYAVQNEMEA